MKTTSTTEHSTHVKEKKDVYVVSVGIGIVLIALLILAYLFFVLKTL